MPELTGRRVLVIGGAGLIGSHVVDELLLEDVAQVIIYDNFTRGSMANLERHLRDPRLRIFEAGGDILHSDVLRSAVQESDQVIHLAALWLLHCNDFPRAAFDVNVRGTFNVLEACRDTGIERLVYSSSASVYGEPRDLPIAETHPRNGRTFYGATKIAGEAMCRAFAQQYGLSYAALRYMNVYGARQDYRGAYVAVIMRWLDRIEQAQPLILDGDGSQCLDFVYVSDCARANLHALRSNLTDRVYNVGTGIGTSLTTLAHLLLELTGATVPIQYAQRGATLPLHRIGATDRAESDLGFRAEISLRDGLERLIAWRASATSATRA